jgi:NADH dehydrogenase (ubiquinone) 1 alpha subcomplex subunit 9
VTVFGASGVMGRILLNRLGKEGYNVVAPFRSDDYAARVMKLCGDLGQIQLFVSILFIIILS